jgi:hypothetical protein
MFQLFMARKTESNFENKKIKSSLFRCFSGGFFLIFKNKKISECTQSAQTLQIKIFSELKQNTKFLKVLLRKTHILEYYPLFGVCMYVHTHTHTRKSLRFQKCPFSHDILNKLLFSLKLYFFDEKRVIF